MASISDKNNINCPYYFGREGYKISRLTIRLHLKNAIKPALPAGFRDFTPEQTLKRERVFSTLRRVFTRYGYAQLETPTMENLATLVGKYGDEGDQLLFKVLNSRIHESKAKEELRTEFERSLEGARNTATLTERALRYDLTVPFARYVVMHQNDIVFPFKRSQMQPVWRADRPSKGRYREFYQCDADVIGSPSLTYEAELIHLYDDVFAELGLGVVIRYNNRKILAGMAETAGAGAQLTAITVAIDKMDKIGREGVRTELQKIGLAEAATEHILAFLTITTLDELDTFLAASPVGLAGVAELREMLDFTHLTPLTNAITLDVTLARGLNYYTGAIFEVVLDTSHTAQAAVTMGSIGGGGRYDNLTDIFALSGVSGVGISFGFERIYDVMDELGLFGAIPATATAVIFLPMTPAALPQAIRAAAACRERDIAAEVYPEAVKFQKQMKYANARAIPFTAIIGEEELAVEAFTLKNMTTGEQVRCSLAGLIEFVSPFKTKD